ncbi:MAG: NAD(P)-binding domain-containing protein [Acholeplasmatales bacterium]|nr:NAD(P)-binding domain-containing protein [Acholeplasmatales bacterium]
MKAYCLNNISKVALATLKKPDTIVEDIKDADSILVRSADMHEMKLDANILAVARAGAGVNNIPLEDYAKEGVVVFNTPGANANAVKELVLAGMLLASRDIIGGNEWVKENADNANVGKDAEKAKKAFAGNEIYGKKIAVLGLGAIGILVANACVDLGMKVVGYDPYLSIKNALKLNKKVNFVEKIADAAKDADFITVHVPAMDTTKGMLNKEVFYAASKGVVVLDFARDTLVNEKDLEEALKNGQVKKFVTDFANANVVKLPNTIVLPHLGASTEEAEDNCAVMAVEELKDFIENGNIRNSVNYPAVDAGAKPATGARVCINHTNNPGIISKFTSEISAKGANIESLVSQSKGEFAYTVLDLNKNVDVKSLASVEGVLRVRVI